MIRSEVFLRSDSTSENQSPQLNKLCLVFDKPIWLTPLQNFYVMCARSMFAESDIHLSSQLAANVIHSVSLGCELGNIVTASCHNGISCVWDYPTMSLSGLAGSFRALCAALLVDALAVLPIGHGLSEENQSALICVACAGRGNGTCLGELGRRRTREKLQHNNWSNGRVSAPQ